MIAIPKSKHKILSEYLKLEISEILDNTTFKNLRNNVFSVDDFNQEENPGKSEGYILIDIMEQKEEYKNFSYGLTFTFILNQSNVSNSIYALEDWFDTNFRQRLINRNKFGIYFNTPNKIGLDMTNDYTGTKTILTSSYTIKAYFNK